MINERDAVLAIYEQRKDQIVVTHMTPGRYWAEISEDPEIIAEVTDSTIETNDELATTAVEDSLAVAIESDIITETAEPQPIAVSKETDDSELKTEIVATDVDEDAILEALILEDEIGLEASTGDDNSSDTQGLSVDSLDTFTLDDIEDASYESEDSMGETDGVIDELPILTPDAGKIRFAEDLVPEQRGGGRSNRRTRRTGAGANNNRRGPGGR